MTAAHVTGIYEIRNTVNGKRYVGSAVNFPNRQRQHFQSLARGDHHCIALQRAYNMYGADSFEFNRLLICSKENLIMYEQIVMDALKAEYNSAPRAGSQLGFKHSAESRAKMSASHPKGFSPRKGVKHTEETKAKISANRKGIRSGEMTPERRAKIGAGNKGKIITPEMRARISAKLTGTSTGRGTLSEHQVREIRRMHSEGMRKCDIARALGIHRTRPTTVIDGHAYLWVK